MSENDPDSIAMQAEHCLVTGQFERARALYERLCDLASDNEELWLMLSVAQAESGALEDAVLSANRAITLDLEYAEAYLTRAHILKKLGQYADARQSALDAVRVDNEYIEAWLFLAGLAGQSRNPEDAEIWAGKVIELAPGNADAYVNLANAQYELGKFDAAHTNYQHALRLQPSGYLAKLGITKTCLALKKFDEAEPHINELLRRNDKDPEVINCLAQLFIARNRIDQALDMLQNLIKMQPQFKPAYLSIARLHYQKKNLAEAIRCLAAAREQMPDQIDILYALAHAHRENGQCKPALECFASILTQNPDDQEIRLNYANVLSDTGDLEGALAQFEALAKQYPDDNRATIACANLHDKLGNYETARELLSPIINSGTPPPVAANAYGQICHHFHDVGRGITLLQNALANTDLSDVERRMMLFTLGKLHDRQGDYDPAFECFHEANTLKPCSYDHAHTSRFFDRLKAFPINTLFPAEQTGNTHEDPFIHIFIVGMPRSGTSLVEQIIASHPHVMGMGERIELGEIVDRLPSAIGEIETYPECLARLPDEAFAEARRYYLNAPEAHMKHARAFTDKMPANFQHLPLILRLFPNARIIHTRRNRLDTCLSIYFQDFGGHHSYAYQLDGIGRYYREYERLMEHYRTRAEIPILEVNYEDLVSEPERISREMIAYCGLEWDNACLTHHRSARIIRTASYNQVREPIHNRSVARWKYYEKHLDTLKKALHSSNAQL